MPHFGASGDVPAGIVLGLLAQGMAPFLASAAAVLLVLKQVGTPLVWTDRPDRSPGDGEIRVQVGACGVCRPDLHVVDGELPQVQVPITVFRHDGLIRAGMQRTQP